MSEVIFCGAAPPPSLGLKTELRCQKLPGHDGPHAFTTPFGITRWIGEAVAPPPESETPTPA